MLVRPHPSGWRLTLHPAHGLLAARIYEKLAEQPTAHDPELALPTLLAVADHDDNQLNFRDADYLTEQGAPKDFTQIEMSDAQRSEQAERLLSDCYRKHLWIYLLVGRHIEWIYGGQNVHPQLSAILIELREQRQKILAARGWSAQLLETTYGCMRFCDRLSLILCGEDTPTLGRRLEINDALGEPAYIRRNESNAYAVDPWPFHEDTITVTVESFVLPKLSFADSAALGEAIGDSKPEVRPFTLARSD